MEVKDAGGVLLVVGAGAAAAWIVGEFGPQQMWEGVAEADAAMMLTGAGAFFIGYGTYNWPIAWLGAGLFLGSMAHILFRQSSPAANPQPKPGQPQIQEGPPGVSRYQGPYTGY